MSTGRVVLSVVAVLAATVTIAPPATAAPSCVAQSVQTEHAALGPAWGHELIAFLATHPEVLEEFGFSSFGEFAGFAARLDRTNCPEDL